MISKKITGNKIRESLRLLIQLQKIYDDSMIRSFYTFNKPNSDNITKAIDDFSNNANKIDLLTSLRAYYNDNIFIDSKTNLSLALRIVERKSRILNVLQMSLPSKERTYGVPTISPQSMNEGVKVQDRNESFDGTLERIKNIQLQIANLKLEISKANNIELEVPELYKEAIP